MKIVTVTINGPVPKQGWAILSCMAAEGGRTSIGLMLVPGATPESVAAGLAQNMTARPEWPNYLKANAKGDTVRVACPDEINNPNGLQFVAEYNPDPDQKARNELNPDWIAIADEAW